MSRHLDAALAVIDAVLEARPANGDEPQVAPVPDEEPAVTDES